MTPPPDARLTLRWTEALVSRPWRALIAGCLLAAVAVVCITGLGFETSLVALLPQEDELFQRRAAMLDEVTSGTDLILEVKGEDPLPFARGLTEALNKSPRVHTATVDFPIEFFETRALYLMPLSDLEALESALSLGVDAMLANPSPEVLQTQAAQLEAFVSKASAPGEDARRMPKNLFTPNKEAVLILIQPAGNLGDYAEMSSLINEFNDIIESQRPGEHGIETTLAGLMATTLWENEQMSSDLFYATLIALVLVILLMVAATRRWVTLLIFSAPLTLGIMLTLGVTALTLGDLNVVSGFMIPALIGLGVDFCIHLYLAYLPKLDAGAPRDVAMRDAILEVARPCALSALTTTAAFAALMLNHFDGVNEYGLIASYGVLIMMASTFLILPPLAMLLTRPRAPKAAPHTAPAPPQRASLLLARATIAVAVLGSAFALWSARDVEFKNDLAAFISDSPPYQDYRRLSEAIGGPIDPTLIMVEDIDHARRVTEVIDEMREEQGDAKTAFGETISASQLVPTETPERAALLASIRGQLNRVDRSPVAPLIQGDALKRFEQLKALSLAEPWGFEALPAFFRERLRSKSGEQQFIFLRKNAFLSVDHEIMRWSDQIDDLIARSDTAGAPISVLDESSIATRMLRLMTADFSRMMIAVVLLMLLIVIVAMRRVVPVLLIMTTIVGGVLCTLGLMAASSVTFNLFNVVVLPSVIGIAIDNAIHLQHGHDQLGPARFGELLSTRGRAALLSSMTTAIGFGAMATAHHGGVASLGVVSLIAMGCLCFFTTAVYASALRLRGETAT